MIIKTIGAVLLTFAGTVFVPDSLLAASSAWLKVPGGEMRLVSAADPESMFLNAALEIKLKKGWKTYWRAPGESGIPPQLSFVGSQNVAAASFNFPTPSYFQDLNTKTVGYKKHVAFPISIKMVEQFKPTTIKLGVVIGICSEICVPVQANLTLTEPGTRSPSFEVSRVINNAKNSVPTAPMPDFKVESVRLLPDNPRKLLISSLVPRGSSSVQMHVEGPVDWYLLPADITQDNAIEGKMEFTLDISDIPEDARPTETELRFTLVSDGRSIEQLLVPEQ